MAERVDIFESYALYNNVDDSIFLLNPAIEKFGYQFIAIDLRTLESDFAGLFIKNPDLKTGNIALFENANVNLSEEFYDALLHMHPIGIDILTQKKAYLLKKLTTVERIVKDGQYTNNELNRTLSEMNGFIITLTTQLRLLIKGDIYHPFVFQSAVNNRRLISRLYSPPYYLSHNTYRITLEDAEKFTKRFSPKLEYNKLTQLAISNFLLIYESRDSRTKFIVLMMCLECMFNHGAEQVSHTVARHVAIIFSTSMIEFENNYKEIKKLYAIRSKLVHGDYPKNDFTGSLERLEEIVRFAIDYCRDISLSKDELFKQLNSKGFNY